MSMALKLRTTAMVAALLTSMFAAGTGPTAAASGGGDILVPLARLNEGKAVQVWQVQGRVYVITGSGANVVLQVGDAASVVVNSGTEALSSQVIAAIRMVTDMPLEYLVLTSADPDVAGGSVAISAIGSTKTGQRLEPDGAATVGHLNVLSRLTAHPVPGARPPTDAYEKHWAFFNDEAIILNAPPAAHTDGDTTVFFRRSDVIVTGGLFDSDRYPIIDRDHGGSIDGVIDALNDIIAEMVPRENEEGGTLVIPNHGRVNDRSGIVNYRDALTIIRARIQKYVAKGMTLEQVLATKPTLDYDFIYGADSGPWTTRQFIEAVYKDSKKNGDKKGLRAGKVA
jgi:cyclase